MSFSCIKHGWQHLFSMCPACTEILVTTNTDGTYMEVLPKQQISKIDWEKVWREYVKTEHHWEKINNLAYEMFKNV